MRQAYDYWQDQPGFYQQKPFARGKPLTNGPAGLSASSLPNSPGSANHCSVVRVLNHSGPTRNRKLAPAPGKRSPEALSNSSLRHAGEPTLRCIREDAGFTLDNDTSSQECNRPPKELGGDYKSRRPSQLRQARDFRTSTCPNMRSYRQKRGRAFANTHGSLTGRAADEQLPAERFEPRVRAPYPARSIGSPNTRCHPRRRDGCQIGGRSR